jgi:hypothetical protein
VAAPPQSPLPQLAIEVVRIEGGGVGEAAAAGQSGPVVLGPHVGRAWPCSSGRGGGEGWGLRREGPGPPGMPSSEAEGQLARVQQSGAAGSCAAPPRQRRRPP